ncbi:MAG: ACP S-malonyltransferase [Coriobacteriia bacterium]|nr:ACP S-malonyltransferase [Coriobacteriia bacterium]MBN2840412.1 ACP S-malonyltransferase [Coriobacteriia bacterium]
MARPVAFVFPGQGSQRIGMLDRVPDAAAARALVADAEDCSGLPLGRLAAEGPVDRLTDTRAAQPLLFIADLLWARAVSQHGIDPVVVAGHSLGEYAALAFSDVLDDLEALSLVCERSRLMADVAEAVGGTMAAVLGMDVDATHAVVDGLDGVWVANENGPGQVVISGTHAGIEHAIGALSAAGARRVVPLEVAGPFHSPLMAPAAEAFGHTLARTTFRQALVPVSQNTGATPTDDADLIRGRLAAQIVSPVGWTAILEAFATKGVEVLVECGPGSVLTGITRRYEGLEGVSADTDGLDRVSEVIG